MTQTAPPELDPVPAGRAQRVRAVRDPFAFRPDELEPPEVHARRRPRSVPPGCDLGRGTSALATGQLRTETSLDGSRSAMGEGNLDRGAAGHNGFYAWRTSSIAGATKEMAEATRRSVDVANTTLVLQHAPT